MYQLYIINFKIEEKQCIFNDKFDTFFRSKETLEEKKNIIALKDNVSTLLESVEKQIINEKQVKEDTALDIERLKQELFRMNKYIENLHQQLNEVHEKKKNSLIFHGIPQDALEREDCLKKKVSSIVRNNLQFRREILITSVMRVMDGPKITGSHPVLVTFQKFDDKEEVLKKAGLLGGTKVHIMEDINTRTKESKTQLRRFMRTVKMNNPEADCSLHYDLLYVDNSVYAWDEKMGKVLKVEGKK